MFYTVGTAEHDAFMMAAGIVHGWHSGEILNPLCYGSDLQFLFYHLFHLAAQAGLRTTDSVLLGMNVMGTLGALAIPILLVRLLARLSTDESRSQLAGLLFMTSPVYLMLVSYGHPFHLALTLSLLAWLLFLSTVAARARMGFRVEGAASQAHVGLRMAGAVALQTAALMTRFEQVALFAVMALALYALTRRRSWREWIAGVGFAMAPVFFFLAPRGLLFGEPAVGHSGAGFWESFSLLLRGMNPGLIQWSAAHFIVEAGGALLLTALACALVCMIRGRWRLVAGSAAGVLPTLAVYAGNPSPPRHFVIAAMGLAYLVAFALPDRGAKLRWSLVGGVLALNLLAPWGLIPLGGQRGGGRAMVAYNVVERTDRNRAEIRAAKQLFARIIPVARHRPVAIFGNWVHMAQISSDLANDPEMRIERTSLPGGARPIVLRSPRFTIYLVEAYEPSTVEGVSAALRREVPGLACVSLVQGAPLNDLPIPVPIEIQWWSS